MGKIKVLLVDDEVNAINALSLIIKEYTTNIEIVGTTNSSKEALKLINGLQPDILFVDIQMPHISGIELVESFKSPRSFEVVFLTAHNNYAQEAFRVEALSYLLKPIYIPAFLNIINQYTQIKNDEQPAKTTNILKEVFQNKISLPTQNGIEFLNISEIVRVEASGSYCNIYLSNGKIHLFSKNLKTMEDLLMEHPFFRAHKSHLINISFIKKFQSLKDGGTITMQDGSEIELSRLHKDEFIKLYKG